MCSALSFGFEGFGIVELEFGIQFQNLGDIRGLRVEDLPGLGVVLGFSAARCPGAGSTASDQFCKFSRSHGSLAGAKRTALPGSNLQLNRKSLTRLTDPATPNLRFS